MRRFRSALPIAAVLLALCGGPAAAQVPVKYTNSDNGRPSLAPLLKQVTNAVVNIAVTSTVQGAPNPLFNDPFFRRFFEGPEGPDQQQQQAPPRTQQAVGSGVIVDAQQGYILTNNHVIEHADKIVVTLKDRRTVNAKLVGTDPGTDVAVLKVDTDNLTAIPFANSDKLQVGDYVVAIGNPFGLGQTVTSGIVSALGRSGMDIEGYEDFIQTDASINPGNSGGALIDLDGKLVGINTAILAPAGGNVGIGFAIPANMAKQVMNQVIKYGEVRRGRLGVYIQNLTPDLADALKLDVHEGAVVTQIEPGSAGEKAGIQVGDVIVAVDGEPVKSGVDLRNKIGLEPVGTNVSLTIVRDGKRQMLTAPIEAASAGAGAGAAGGGNVPQLQGAEFRDVPPDYPTSGVQGAWVARIATGSPAERNGLQQGDVIVAVNRTPIHSAAELDDAIKAAGSSTVALTVVRGNARLFLVLR